MENRIVAAGCRVFIEHLDVRSVVTEAQLEDTEYIPRMFDSLVNFAWYLGAQSRQGSQSSTPKVSRGYNEHTETIRRSELRSPRSGNMSGSRSNVFFE